MIAASLTAGARGTERMQPETLHYKVMFKWGLINKKAGSATLTLSHGPKSYLAKLTAASEGRPHIPGARHSQRTYGVCRTDTPVL